MWRWLEQAKTTGQADPGSAWGMRCRTRWALLGEVGGNVAELRRRLAADAEELSGFVKVAASCAADQEHGRIALPRLIWPSILSGNPHRWAGCWMAAGEYRQ